MTEKIYGVSGLMEWEALIVCGKVRLRARFEGGSSSGFGEAPALYRTTNPAAQHIIEHSDYFKEKRIRLLRIRHFADSSDQAETSSPAKTQEAGSAPGATARLILEEKHFNDPHLARRFLHENFGVPMSKMSSYASIREAGELYGYKVSWDK